MPATFNDNRPAGRYNRKSEVYVTYRGRVKNGVVVLDKSCRLEDGTVVNVEPAPPSRRNGHTRRTKRPRRGSPAAILAHVGTWVGEPGEMDRLLAALRQMKEAEVVEKETALKLAARAGAANGEPSKRRKRLS